MENCVIIITYQPLIYDRLWRVPMIRTCFRVVSPEKFFKLTQTFLETSGRKEAVGDWNGRESKKLFCFSVAKRVRIIFYLHNNFSTRSAASINIPFIFHYNNRSSLCCAAKEKLENCWHNCNYKRNYNKTLLEPKSRRKNLLCMVSKRVLIFGLWRCWCRFRLDMVLWWMWCPG